MGLFGGTIRAWLARATSQVEVTVARDAVAMGDDMVDNTRTYRIDDRTPPTVESVIASLRAAAPWVWVQGAPTTWVLHAGARDGRRVAVLRLDADRRTVDVHATGDLTAPVVTDDRFHLEYLATQSVERTLELIAAGAPSLRDLQA